jgi:hypothetical protein
MYRKFDVTGNLLFVQYFFCGTKHSHCILEQKDHGMTRGEGQRNHRLSLFTGNQSIRPHRKEKL